MNPYVVDDLPPPYRAACEKFLHAPFLVANGTSHRDTLRKNYGRIAFAHSELDGLQHYGPAADEGRRAFRQLADVL